MKKRWGVLRFIFVGEGSLSGADCVKECVERRVLNLGISIGSFGELGLGEESSLKKARGREGCQLVSKRVGKDTGLTGASPRGIMISTRLQTLALANSLLASRASSSARVETLWKACFLA
jgi:hypothetical protein